MLKVVKGFYTLNLTRLLVKKVPEQPPASK